MPHEPQVSAYEFYTNVKDIAAVGPPRQETTTKPGSPTQGTTAQPILIYKANLPNNYELVAPNRLVFGDYALEFSLRTQGPQDEVRVILGPNQNEMRGSKGK